jgi:hypothetical protein
MLFAAAGAIFATATVAAAQDVGYVLSTDRPTVAATPTLVPDGQRIIEAGFSATMPRASRSVSVGEVYYRQGLNDFLEFNTGLPGYVQPRPALGDAGWTDASVGLRVGLRATPRGATPQLAALIGTSLPTGSEGIGATKALASATLLAGWALPGRLGLTSNLGWAQQEAGDRVLVANALAMPARGGITAYLEHAITRTEDAWDPALLTLGATVLVTPQLQFDAYIRRAAARGLPGGSFGFGIARAF